MKLLHRYVFVYFIKIFFVINIVLFLITAIYGLADIFLSFKSRSLEIGIKYVLLLIPFVFYYLSPLSYTAAGLIVVKRLIDRRVDLTAQSFGITPYSLVFPLIVFVIALSTFHIVMNENVYPKVYKEIKYIEEKYKVRKKVERKIARNIWLLKKVNTDKVYVHIKTLEIDSGKFIDLLMIKVSENDRVKEITEGKHGIWKGEFINISKGFNFNFIKGDGNEELLNKTLYIGFDLKEVSLLAERIEFLSSSSLFTLFSKGEEIGIDTNQYLGELMYRLGTSLFPIFIFIPVISNFLTVKSIKRSLLLFFIIMISGWFFITLSKILPSEAKTSPIYVLIPYTLLLLYCLKGIYNLRKGHRV